MTRRTASRSRSGPGGLWVVVAAMVLAAGLSGCVRVPVSGPVERVGGQQPACQNCVTVSVDPPSLGDSPLQVVQGFLRANNSYQPNYSVARQFLTPAAASTWRPEAGVTIYRGFPAARGPRVGLTGTVRGTLGPDRTYTTRIGRLRVDFGLTREAGEWRISRPPAGLLVEEYAFSSYYQSYNLYFFGRSPRGPRALPGYVPTLVPEPIYLPDVRSQAGVASVLTNALLSGPSAWLRPAVTTTFPPGTALSVDSVSVLDGVATIPLSDAVVPLNDQQRRQLATQVVYTLKQVAGVQGVAVTVNGQPLAIPGADPATGVLSVDVVAREMDPIPAVAGDSLYVLRRGKVEVVSQAAGDPATAPVPGPVGDGRPEVSSLAASLSNTDFALVTGGGRRVQIAPVAGGKATTVLTGVSRVLRPQFTRFGELWVLGRMGGRQRLWVISGGRRVEVASPVLSQPISAFKVSPDGSRIALVRRAGPRSELGLARVIRAQGITLDGWLPLNLSRAEEPTLASVQDVSWSDATDLLVLGTESAAADPIPYRVSQDASTISVEGDSTGLKARTLTTLLGSQSAVVVGKDDQAWRNDGTQWLPFLDQVSAATYPG